MEQELQNERELRIEAEQRVLDQGNVLEELRRQLAQMQELQLRQDEEIRRLRQEQPRAEPLAAAAPPVIEQQPPLAPAVIPPPGRVHQPQPAAAALEEQRVADALQYAGQLQVREERIPFSMTVSQLPVYTADDKTKPVKAWLERVVDDAIFYAWSEEEKFFAAKRALDGSAKKWLDSQREPRTWAQLRTGLEENFGRKIKLSDIHELLRSRRKENEESVIAYMQSMELLGSQGELEADEVHRYVIRGFTNEPSMRMMLSTASTRSQLIEMLEVYELETQAKAARQARSSGSRNQQKYSERTCHRCKKPGHLIRECTEPEFACFKCKKPGHKANECPNGVSPDTSWR